MKINIHHTEKPESCNPLSSIGIEYLNALLKRIISQKEYSKHEAPEQTQGWRKRELQVRKCINLAQRFADEL